MPVIVGSNGNCTINGVSANFNTWSQSINVVESEVTKFTDLSRKVVPGLVSSTFTAAGTANDDAQLFGADAAIAPSVFQSSQVVLTANTGCTTTFAALITAFDLSSTVNGDFTFSLSGSSNGDITLAWGGD
mgnify:CR=1 FL=1